MNENMIDLRDWSFVHIPFLWYAPFDNDAGIRLCGNVYGHPKHDDGVTVVTSRVKNISPMDGYVAIQTENSLYRISKETVSKQYEQAFPDVYEKIIGGYISRV